MLSAEYYDFASAMESNLKELMRTDFAQLIDFAQKVSGLCQDLLLQFLAQDRTVSNDAGIVRFTYRVLQQHDCSDKIFREINELRNNFRFISCEKACQDCRERSAEYLADNDDGGYMERFFTCCGQALEAFDKNVGPADFETRAQLALAAIALLRAYDTAVEHYGSVAAALEEDVREIASPL